MYIIKVKDNYYYGVSEDGNHKWTNIKALAHKFEDFDDIPKNLRNYCKKIKI